MVLLLPPPQPLHSSPDTSVSQCVGWIYNYARQHHAASVCGGSVMDWQTKEETCEKEFLSRIMHVLHSFFQK
jgi:hypothetical protein